MKKYIICFIVLLLLITACSKKAEVETEQQITDRSLLDVKERGKSAFAFGRLLSLVIKTEYRL